MDNIREELIKLLKATIKGNTFKRKAAELKYGFEIVTNYANIADHLLANGVTVQKEGIWIGEGDGYADGEIVYDVWYCGNCNHCIDDGTDDYDLLPNFCPSCGMKKLPLPTPPKGE